MNLLNDLTVVVLTRDEEAYIGGCLDSLTWCGRVIVLDSLSTDRTVEIAGEHGAQVILRPFQNFADQRNAGVNLVQTDWVFFVDADERVSPELAGEVLSAIACSGYTGYWIPTHNYQLGRLIRHAGLYPDYHLRLFRKTCGHYDQAQTVHERVTLEGTAGYLTHPLIHISCETWENFTDHQERYAWMKAQAQFARGVKPSYHFIAGPILEFVRRYVRLRGYRDGLHGLRLSAIFAYYYFIMYIDLARLWKMHSHKNAPQPHGSG